MAPTSADTIVDLCPTPSGVTLADEIHDRSYIVRVFRTGEATMLARGAVRDTKPAGVYLAGDPLPITVHEMIVDLEVAIPSLQITGAHVVMEAFPYEPCPSIQPHYQQVVGLNIGRGFTHAVRELFGGPRGCSHITALLQAMAPAVFQAMWSVFHLDHREAPTRDDVSIEEKLAIAAPNVNSCHLWPPGGHMLTNIEAGAPDPIPIWIRRRTAELGGDPTRWEGNVT